MANTNTRFNGELNGKTIYDFVENLDYTLNQEDRIKFVKEILYPFNSLDDYFVEFFDKYYKTNLIAGKNGDPLSEEINVFQILDRIANYILYSPEAERITKKTKYNFYTEEQLKKKMDREKSIEEMSKKAEGENIDGNNDSYDDVIDFLIRKGTNYKKEVKQVVTNDDYKDPELSLLKDYKLLSDSMKHDLNQLKLLEKNKNLQNRLISQIKYLKDDQILIKDMFKGTIYFKAILPDSCVIDYDQFDFFDKEHVMALLKISPRINLSQDLGCLLYDLNYLLHKCRLSNLEKDILKLYREDDSTEESIAQKVGTTQPNIHSILLKICDRVIYAYENNYEDWYYLNVVKGKYKRCNKCKKNKIANERHFSLNPDSKDGYYSICKKCRQKT